MLLKTYELKALVCQLKATSAFRLSIKMIYNKDKVNIRLRL